MNNRECIFAPATIAFRNLLQKFSTAKKNTPSDFHNDVTKARGPRETVYSFSYLFFLSALRLRVDSNTNTRTVERRLNSNKDNFARPASERVELWDDRVENSYPRNNFHNFTKEQEARGISSISSALAQAVQN